MSFLVFCEFFIVIRECYNCYFLNLMFFGQYYWGFQCVFTILLPLNFLLKIQTVYLLLDKFVNHFFTNLELNNQHKTELKIWKWNYMHCLILYLPKIIIAIITIIFVQQTAKAANCRVFYQFNGFILFWKSYQRYYYF